jgi:RNA polymerase sigma-70 factor (ECF subfamily)
MTDRDTVTKLLSGNHRELHHFYRQASLQLKRFFLSHTAEPEDCDELIQDTFLHFLDALPLFNYQSTLTTFMVSIAHHELADYWRKKYAKRLIRTIPIVKNYIAPIQTSARTSLLLHRSLESTYQKLHPQSALLLRMKYEDALSVKEIAAKLGLSPKAVECGLYRARKAFQLSYKENQP